MSELKRILLAEDNANDVELTLAALEEHHLANEVVVVRDGEEALHYLKRQGPYQHRPEGNPAVVLLDLKMPKVDGLQVLAGVKADEFLKNIPVVMLTSSREEKDLVTSYKLSVNAYVVKPVNFSEFSHAVKNLGIFLGVAQRTSAGQRKEKNMTQALRILHLEDDANDAELIALQLSSENQRGTYDLLQVPTAIQFSEALDKGLFDVILSDSSGPSFNGKAALALAREKQPRAVFLFVSGYDDRNSADATRKTGADGFVLKHQLDTLIPAIQHALKFKP